LNPLSDSPFARSGPEGLSAIPSDPVFVALGAVAGETAGYDVGEICCAAEYFGDDVIESAGAAEVLTAVAALEVPVEVYLVALLTRKSHRPNAAGRIRLRLDQ